MSERPGALRAFVMSFAHAFRGLGIAVRTQRNMRVHLAALVLVIVLGFVFQIAPWEWCVVVLVSGIVMAAELLNTAIEWLADRVSREREESIRNIKDAAAGAVLAASIAAAAVGAIIFLPRLLAL